MDILSEIRTQTKKPKEVVSNITKRILETPALLDQVIEILQNGNRVEKGIAAEVLEAVSQENSEIVFPVIAVIIDNLTVEIGRVRWELGQVIRNLAFKYAKELTVAIPLLLENTSDKETLVRWSAARALTAISRYDPETQKELLPKFRSILEAEENQGVKKIYLRRLQELKKLGL